MPRPKGTTILFAVAALIGVWAAVHALDWQLEFAAGRRLCAEHGGIRGAARIPPAASVLMYERPEEPMPVSAGLARRIFAEGRFDAVAFVRPTDLRVPGRFVALTERGETSAGKCLDDLDDRLTGSDTGLCLISFDQEPEFRYVRQDKWPVNYDHVYVRYLSLTRTADEAVVRSAISVDANAHPFVTFFNTVDLCTIDRERNPYGAIGL